MSESDSLKKPVVPETRKANPIEFDKIDLVSFFDVKRSQLRVCHACGRAVQPSGSGYRCLDCGSGWGCSS